MSPTARRRAPRTASESPPANATPECESQPAPEVPRPSWADLPELKGHSLWSELLKANGDQSGSPSSRAMPNTRDNRPALSVDKELIMSGLADSLRAGLGEQPISPVSLSFAQQVELRRTAGSRTVLDATLVEAARTNPLARTVMKAHICLAANMGLWPEEIATMSGGALKADDVAEIIGEWQQASECVGRLCSESRTNHHTKESIAVEGITLSASPGRNGVIAAADAGTHQESVAGSPVPVESQAAGTDEGKPADQGTGRVDHSPSQESADLVTLNQAAASVHCSKRTLERYKTSGKLPEPAVERRRGRSHLYDWKVMRHWLESEFDMKLPEEFPANRRHG